MSSENWETRHGIKSSCQNQHTPIKNEIVVWHDFSVFKVEHPRLASSLVSPRHQIIINNNKTRKKIENRNVIKAKLRKNFHIFFRRASTRISVVHTKCICIVCSLFLVLRKKIDTFCLAESKPLHTLFADYGRYICVVPVHNCLHWKRHIQPQMYSWIFPFSD